MRRHFRTSTRSLKSRALNFATAVSAALFLLVVALWIRTALVLDEVIFTDAGWGLWVIHTSVAGRISIEHAAPWPVYEPYRWLRFNRIDHERAPEIGGTVADAQSLTEYSLLGSTYFAGPRYVKLRRDGTPAWYGDLGHEDLRSAPSAPVTRWFLLDLGLALPATILFVLPLLWMIVHLHRRAVHTRRLASGKCPACAYDLRATPERGGSLLERCPECGTVPKRRGVPGH